MYVLTEDGDGLTTVVGVFSTPELALDAAHAYAGEELDECLPECARWVQVTANSWFMDCQGDDDGAWCLTEVHMDQRVVYAE